MEKGTVVPFEVLSKPRLLRQVVIGQLLVWELEAGDLHFRKFRQNLALLSAEYPLVVVDVRCQNQVVPR